MRDSSCGQLTTGDHVDVRSDSITCSNNHVYKNVVIVPT